eukprot:9282880-Pyramimonas_sp.AAC.5
MDPLDGLVFRTDSLVDFLLGLLGNSLASIYLRPPDPPLGVHLLFALSSLRQWVYYECPK